MEGEEDGVGLKFRGCVEVRLLCCRIVQEADGLDQSMHRYIDTRRCA